MVLGSSRGSSKTEDSRDAIFDTVSSLTDGDFQEGQTESRPSLMALYEDGMILWLLDVEANDE